MPDRSYELHHLFVKNMKHNSFKKLKYYIDMNVFKSPSFLPQSWVLWFKIWLNISNGHLKYQIKNPPLQAGLTYPMDILTF